MKKMSEETISQEIPEEDEELTPEQKRELKRRLADSLSMVRYVVYSDITGDGKWRLWLDVSMDGYGMTIDQATLFKREHVARAVAEVYSEKGRKDIHIAKITTKNGKRKVLKYKN